MLLVQLHCRRPGKLSRHVLCLVSILVIVCKILLMVVCLGKVLLCCWLMVFGALAPFRTAILSRRSLMISSLVYFVLRLCIYPLFRGGIRSRSMSIPGTHCWRLCVHCSCVLAFLVNALFCWAILMPILVISVLGRFLQSY